MKTFFWQDLSEAEKKEALARPLQKDDAGLSAAVADISKQVKERGDDALREFSAKFDGVSLNNCKVSERDIALGAGSIDPSLRAAMEQAKANIKKFHEAEKPPSVKVETMPGVLCELHWRPLDNIGIYIPGGTAPLFSAVLMQAVPARIAGCRRIVLCTPPGRDGKINSAILAAAHMCGIGEVYAVGGAQAIAAMAYGTGSIPKADKIFGPGNAYVTEAKKQVSRDPDGAAIDMPAGPSEVMVIADASARAEWVAADLLAQAEHDVSAQAILVTTDASFGNNVKGCMMTQLPGLKRMAIIAQSISEGRVIVVPDMKGAIDVANLYAPEHLLIHNHDAAKYLPDIRHAGSVFLGAWSPESAGDYASGTNHVLPTYGYARAYSGLSLVSFMKSMSVQTLTHDGLQRLGPIIVKMAEAEGLDAHAAAVKVRLENNS